MKLRVNRLLCLVYASILLPSSGASPTALPHDARRHNITTLESRTDSAESWSGVPIRLMRPVWLVVETERWLGWKVPGTDDVVYGAQAAVAFGATADDPIMTVGIRHFGTDEVDVLDGLCVREYPSGIDVGWDPFPGPWRGSQHHDGQDFVRLPHQTGLTNAEIFHSSTGEGIASEVWGKDPEIRLGPGVTLNDGIVFVEKLLGHELVFHDGIHLVDPGIPPNIQKQFNRSKMHSQYGNKQEIFEAPLMNFQSPRLASTFESQWPNPPEMLEYVRRRPF